MSKSHDHGHSAQTSGAKIAIYFVLGLAVVGVGTMVGAGHAKPLMWIPLLPFAGAAFNLLFGRKLPNPVVHSVACGGSLGSLGVVLGVVAGQLYPLWKAAHAVGPDSVPQISNVLFQWITAGPVHINMALLLDPLSAVMVVTVTFVGSLIHIYSTGYMAHEEDYARFFGYLNLFTGSMLMLVLGDSLVVMFVGWEGVGVCSYLLIGFWYSKSGTEKAGDENSTAGKKAFIVNRIGDFAFILGMFLLFSTVGSLAFADLANNTEALRTTWNPFGSGVILNIFLPGVGSLIAGQLTGLVMLVMVVGGLWVAIRVPGFLTRSAGVLVFLVGWVWSIYAGFSLPAMPLVSVAGVAGVLFLIGASGKSAQIPLYIWLPDAMAGPTPVSALIHAATMVTAGVYMVARLNFMYMLSPAAMGLVALIGALTALFAATIGFAQNDIKKVLAYSTVSQLGYMFIGVGVGAFSAGIFHLFTHAFFKACLFLGAGAVIHAMSGKQDIREMGGLKKWMPITHMTFFISCLAISGIPVFVGFFSKDEILWKAISTMNPSWGPAFSYLIYVLALAGAICTAFYMFRLYYLTFSGENRADEHTQAHIHEQPVSMTMPLSVLALGATVLGFLGLPGVLGEHVNLFHNWLAPVVDRGHRMVEAMDGFAAVKPGSLAHNHGAEWGLMALSVLVAVGSIMFARKWYKGGAKPAVEAFVQKIPRLHRVVYDKYRVDEFYHFTVVRSLRWLCILGSKGIDFVIDFIGVDGVAWVVKWVGQKAAQLQNGNIQRYLVGVMVGVAVVVFWTTLPPDNFSAKPGTEVVTGQDVQFSADHATVNDGRKLVYRWDFDGDGKVDFPEEKDAWTDKATVSHAYVQKGTYEVVLHVRDTRWLTTASESLKVEVK